MRTTSKIGRVYAEFFKSFTPDGVTHLMGISLIAPDAVSNVEHFNATGKEQRRDIIRKAMNIIDYSVHGRKHFDLAASEKFDFSARVETVSKHGRSIPAHMHIALQLTGDLVRRFDDTWPANSSKIRRAVAAYGFRPTVHVTLADDVDKLKDYLTKWVIDDADEVYTRNTLLGSLQKA